MSKFGPFGMFLLACTAAPAGAATVTVNSTNDVSDGTCNTTHCSLREAMAAANANDTIVFAFAGTSTARTIQLGSDLPEINDTGLTIDGLNCVGCGTVAASTSAATSGLNGSLGIRIVRASPTTASNSTFRINATGVTLKGLNIADGAYRGIYIGAATATISHCFIGTSLDGMSASPNVDHGIYIAGVSGVTLGPGLLISGNTNDGIRAAGDFDNLTITGSIIGLNKTGTAALGNGDDGLDLDPDSSTVSGVTIGGSANLANVISGNSDTGVELWDKLSGGGSITYNRIGTNAAGTADLGNADEGISVIGSSGNEPSGWTISNNVISGNNGEGIFLEACNLFTITSNWIGTNSAGANLGNGGSGVHIYGGTGSLDSKQHAIGGTTEASANHIAWNGADGVRIQEGNSDNAKQNAVRRNSIHDNVGIGIDLEGPTSGSGSAIPASGIVCTNNNALGNRGTPRPIIATAVRGSSSLTVTGGACTGATVDLWATDTEATDYGEPMTYLGTVTAGTLSFSATLSSAAAMTATEITVTQTDSDNETSEASGNATVVICDVDGDGALSSTCGGTDCDDNDATRYPGATEVCDGVDNDCAGGVPATETDDDNDGYSECEGDCSDTSNTRYPGATELCNGLDDNCDSTVPLTEIDNDGDTVTECNGDCNDANAAVRPGIAEACDGIDTNCDSVIPTDETDDDFDGQTECEGDCNDAVSTIRTGATELCNGIDDNCDSVVPLTEIDNDSDTFSECQGDCADNAATRYPGAAELCNGIDDDCDTVVPLTEIDNDSDTFSECQGDCADNAASRYPGATEQCNGLDDDCDTVLPANEADADGDTVMACAGDCDDADATVYPGATELCDGIDNDCVGGPGATEVDADADTWMVCLGDCDDGDAAVRPLANEVCDGVDTDCDGDTPEWDLDPDSDLVSECNGDCGPDDPGIYPGATEVCDGIDGDCDTLLPPDEADGDLDGSMICDGDCDDGGPDTYPGAPELCDGFDNDCAGGVPQNEIDGDGDGLSACAGDCDDTNSGIVPGAPEGCDLVDSDCSGAPADDELDGDADGYAPCQGDCDDANDTIAPGEVEFCDAIDQDCDGTVDEGWDNDGDAVTSCGPDGVSGTADDDCDDAEPLAFPGALELCDGFDNDCDGTVDENLDLDLDGYTNCDGDCDDGNPAVHPTAAEGCDGLDTDCDSVVPDVEVDDDLDGLADCEGDCDDTATDIYPGADEICDGEDSDCDGAIPNDEIDGDGDGFAPCEADCDDGDAAISPAAEEICFDGIDQDCSGDDGGAEDRDGDTYLDAACGGDDCDDENAAVHPGAEEACDGVDSDCDGQLPLHEQDGDGDTFPPCDGDCDDVDFDGDGWADCDECDDTDSAVHPGAEEICGDAIDEDCDGLAPPCAPVQLGAAQPPGGCDCRTTVAPGRGSLLAIVFGLALIRRRRRGAAAALLLAGCPGGAGTLTPYWGTLAGDGAAADFAAGSSRDAAIHRDESEGATHLAVVDAAGCDAYAAFLAQVAATRAALSDGLGSGDAATWAGWVCQDVAGAARDAFGGEGAFSALHVLTESAPGERARPAWVGAAPDGSEAEAAFDGFSMPAGTYVAGALQRTVADRGLLPDTALVPDDDGAARFLCQARVQAILASDRPVGEPPGRFATEAIAAAFDRFDHQFVFDAEARGEDGGATPIGLTHGDGGFDLLTFARVPDAEIAGAQHVAVRAEAASEEVCDGLGTALDLLWPARTEGAAP